MTTLINDWGKARATPSPSECSDVFSEYSDHNPDLANYPQVPPISPTVQNALPVTPPDLLRRTPESRTEDNEEDESDSPSSSHRVQHTIVQRKPYNAPAHASTSPSGAEPPMSRDACATPVLRPQARFAAHNRTWADIVKS